VNRVIARTLACRYFNYYNKIFFCNWTNISSNYIIQLIDLTKATLPFFVASTMFFWIDDDFFFMHVFSWCWNWLTPLLAYNIG
jgi:hypothetical protein